NQMDVLGRIYVAQEGINAQLSVPAKRFDEFKTFLDGIDFLENVRLNIAIEQDAKSFLKLKVKVRPKIVADGLDDDTFDVTNKGVHVDAATFNELIEADDVVLVDMRNHYESEIGHFKNAVTPDVDTFRDSLDLIEEDLRDHKEDKKLVMYCTGGIRCEKASAYYKHKGFKQVYQLEGGIIEYARQVEQLKLENKFKGKNFVFDHRRGERISEDIISNCHQCGKPCDTHVNCANEACHLLFIQCDECAEAMNHTCSDECKEVIALPYEVQKELRKGIPNSNKIFKKGRSEKLKFQKKV
ncbi:MAG: rhodanese-related sulfurtransferase, partial [Bacteroidota bacterium]|nr:rhodanese-related sulfurtransferase [Bacteroidota bacterium]